VEGVGGKVSVKQLGDVRIMSVRKPTAPKYAEPGAAG